KTHRYVLLFLCKKKGRARQIKVYASRLSKILQNEVQCGENRFVADFSSGFWTETIFAMEGRVIPSRRGDVDKTDRFCIGTAARSGNTCNGYSYSGAGTCKCAFSHG